jgi:hypothetical protein
MSAATTDYDWAQGESKDDATVEVNVQLDVPAGVRAREIAVSVKEGDIVCVTHKDAVVLQWRLHDDIDPEVEWRLEGGNRIVLDMQKKDPEAWPCLLRLPLKADDALLLTAAEVDALLATELKPLPPVAGEVAAAVEDKADADADADKADADKADADKADADKADADEPDAEADADADADKCDKLDDDDLDAMLDEAADEALVDEAAKPAADEAPAAEEETAVAAAPAAAAEDLPSAFVEAELKGIEEETKEMKAVIERLSNELIEADAESPEAETLAKKIKICELMVEQSARTRALRSGPSSLETFRQIQQCDIFKGRLNGGTLDSAETEDYADDAEKEMSFTALLQNGVNHLQGGDVAVALHFLRLAAIHHNHSVSICLLHRIYSEMGFVAKAAYFVVKRANDADNDPATNMLVAEFFDRGLRHFPPLMGPAVHYYQRAALNGSTHAMLSLAQTFKNGCCNAAMSDDDAKEKTNSSHAKFMAWLQAAIDRGAGNAYFVRGCMHMTGEKGVAKSYADAKKFIDKVKAVAPQLIQKAPGIYDRLEKLRREEQGDAPAIAAAADDDIPEVHPQRAVVAAPAAQPKPAAASSRLAALEKKSGFGAEAAAGGKSRGMLGKSGGNGGLAAWETLTRVGVACYGLYTLAFPIRLLLLPRFYAIVEALLGTFGAAPAQADGAGASLF